MARDNNGKSEKKITRYTYDDIKEPRTPETGHTSLLPADEQVVTLPMDNGWSKAIKVGKLPESDQAASRCRYGPGARTRCSFGRASATGATSPCCRFNAMRSFPSPASRRSSSGRAARRTKNPEKSRQGHLFADLEKNAARK